MTDLKELIEQEIDQYLEWPTADKSHVTTVSAKLFAEHVARLYADHVADARKKVGRPKIREVFLRNGASIPADRDDLPDYVYESVFELLEMTALAVQGEPVGEVRFELGAPSYVYGEICSDAAPRLAPGTKLYAAPQPADQRPSADDLLTPVPDELFAAEFAAWWDEHGQFCRAGGGTYERTFAFEEWRHLYPQLMNLQMAAAEQQPAPDVEGLVDALEKAGDALYEQDDSHAALAFIDAALAAHRKGGDA